MHHTLNAIKTHERRTHRTLSLCVCVQFNKKFHVKLEQLSLARAHIHTVLKCTVPFSLIRIKVRIRTHLSWHDFVFAYFCYFTIFLSPARSRSLALALFESFQLNGQMIVFVASISLVVHMMYFDQCVSVFGMRNRSFHSFFVVLSLSSNYTLVISH